MQLGTDSTAMEAMELLMALVLGGIVRLERRVRGHRAGIHTNALVSLGSAAGWGHFPGRLRDGAENGRGQSDDL